MPKKPTLKLLDFTATWCPPCKAQKPILKRFADAHPDIEIEYVDLDTDTALVSRYRVSAVPTLIFVDADGKTLAREVGLQNLTELRQLAETARGKLERARTRANDAKR